MYSVFFSHQFGTEARALSNGKNSDIKGKLGKFIFNDYNEVYL